MERGDNMIVYDKLWETMKKKEISKYHLIRYCNVSAGQLSRLKKNCFVSTHTINMLCTLLKCDVADIMEFVPDPPEETDLKKADVPPASGS